MSEVGGTVSSVESSSHISSDGVKLVRVNITVNNPGTLTKGMAATATVNAGAAGVIYPAESGSLEYIRAVSPARSPHTAAPETIPQARPSCA